MMRRFALVLIAAGLSGCGDATVDDPLSTVDRGDPVAAEPIPTASTAGDDRVADVVGTTPFVAYAWRVEPGLYESIFPFHWLLSKNLDPVRAREATDAIPHGHRVLFSWHILSGIGGNRRDFCRDAEGKLTNIPGVWWDHGAEAVARRLDAFLREYKAIGGHVDTFVLDYEGTVSNWALKRDSKRYEAIMADPRFDAIAEKLGFRDLHLVRNFRRGPYYRKWNVLMQSRLAQYINTAVYEPLKKHFPDATLSNYRYFYNCAPHSCPDFHGHDTGEQTVELGLRGTKLLHVGTHQSRSIYGVLGQLADRRVTDGKFGGDGPRYGRGPFQAFRHSVNQMRSMVLSSDVPVQPWIPHKGWEGNRTRESDLYQELLFHIGLCNPHVFLYWNAWKKGDNPGFAKDRVVDDCLLRLTELAGASDRQTLVRELATWDGAYVLTGMNAGGRSVWRFTPNLPEGGTRDGTLASESPTLFQVGDVVVSIPGGRVHRSESEVSTLGYWVIAGLNAEPVISRVSE